MFNIEPFLAQHVSGFLLSWWKALLIVPAFVAWAWLISAKLDKDARYFHLNHRMWNGIHLGAGVAALAASLAIPIFWIGWPVGILLMLGPVLAYWHVRNRAVPESQQFHLSSLSFSEALSARKQARAAKQALLQFTDSKRTQRPVPLRDDPLFPVHMAAEDILGPALLSRASRVDIVAGASGGAVAQSIDGVRYRRETVPTDVAVRLIDFFKDLAGLDTANRRTKQIGDFRLRNPSGEVAVSIETKGSSAGQTISLEFDRAKRLQKPFDGLGLLASQLEGLRALAQPHERHGIILVGAPPGHGLSTTAYSFLGRHDAYTSNVKTLEREIQLELLGVDQVRWDPNNPDIDYATNLQSILRRDPDIVLVDEVKDRETARVVIEPGLKGPLIYVKQPLPSVEEQIRDWVKKVGDVKEAVRSLRAVTNQRLLRSLCPNCRQAYQPSAEQLKKLNIPAKKVSQLYRPGGKVQVKNKIEDCPVCGGTGYLGQTAAFQVMIIDEEARKLLATGDLNGARAHARRNNMLYLQEAALSKVISGESSLEEVARISAAGAAEAGSAAAPAGGAPPPQQPTPVAR